MGSKKSMKELDYPPNFWGRVYWDFLDFPKKIWGLGAPPNGGPGTPQVGIRGVLGPLLCETAESTETTDIYK